ncbi:Multi antimicrobial extrusion protein [Dillenia turbinata]|uniref:Protein DETOXIFICATION n=1 Tax=Dillenia turbinata TaxID=194707 RepID=A0AAN8UYG3_9MAGN
MGREDRMPSLSSPLIQGAEEEKSTKARRKVVIEEVKKQLWLAGPLIGVSLLQFCLQLISVMFVGHLGELALSSASLGTSFTAVTGICLMTGLASALDTLCGQSYGAKQYHMLGIHMQCAMLILMLVCVPLSFIWANTGTLLIAVGQDDEIASGAEVYARYMIPSIFAVGLLQPLIRFLQTQNIVFPMMISSGFVTLLHIPVCWVLVFKSGLGIRGAALANAISYWFNVFFLALYVKFSPSCAKTWKGFSTEALHNIPSFLKLAIPSAVMVCLEMWSFEMMVLLSGLLPDPKLETSVLSISLNTSSTMWMIPFGLGAAVSTRVSNELGAGHAHATRLAVVVGLVMALTGGIVLSLTLILMRNIGGYAYTNETEVINYITIMMPLLAISIFLDGFQAVLSGVARGCGWQKIGAFVNLGSYYLIGIPSAILLAFFFHIGGKGLWVGIISALVVQLICLSIITIRTDWDQEAKKATQRVYDSILPVDAVS